MAEMKSNNSSNSDSMEKTRNIMLIIFDSILVVYTICLFVYGKFFRAKSSMSGSNKAGLLRAENSIRYARNGQIENADSKTDVLLP